MKGVLKLTLAISACLVTQLAAIDAVGAEDGRGEHIGPWFGLPLPGAATAAEVLQEGGDLPQLRSPYSGTVPEFDGEQAHRWLTDIVAFSYESRDSGEQFWGRMSGSPSYNRTVDYIERVLKDWSLPVRRHEVPFYGPDRVPTDFHAQVVMEDGQGSQLGSLALQSAFPARYRAIQGGDGRPVLGRQTMQAKAEVVSIGAGSKADIATRDLRGKIAFATIPSEPTPFYAEFRKIAAQVGAGGAVGLVWGWNTPGNMHTALGNCDDMPCMNLGGRDASFLRALLARAAKSGRKVVIDLGVNTLAEDDKKTSILTLKIPGKDHSNNVLLTAHADAYLSGANDNASGVAIVLELINYYRKNQPKYDMYFSISPGHHSDTQGIRPFLEVYPDVPASNLLAINIEHVAQRGVARSQAALLPWGVEMEIPSNYDDAPLLYKYMNAASNLREIQLSHPESPIVSGIMEDVVTRHRFIAPANPMKSTFQTEIGPVADAGGITFQPVETSIFYHTSGDTTDTVAPETLEAMALFFKDLIDEFSKHTRDEIVNY